MKEGQIIEVISSNKRNNMDKYYKIPSHKIKQLIKSTIGCIASDKITVDGENARHMYREEPDNIYDSGWRFFSWKRRSGIY